MYGLLMEYFAKNGIVILWKKSYQLTIIHFIESSGLTESALRKCIVIGDGVAAPTDGTATGYLLRLMNLTNSIKNLYYFFQTPNNIKIIIYEKIHNFISYYKPLCHCYFV